MYAIFSRDSCSGPSLWNTNQIHASMQWMNVFPYNRAIFKAMCVWVPWQVIGEIKTSLKKRKQNRWKTAQIQELRSVYFNWPICRMYLFYTDNIKHANLKRNVSLITQTCSIIHIMPFTSFILINKFNIKFTDTINIISFYVALCKLPLKCW